MIGEDNVYACSDICLEQAIRDSLKRASLPDEAKLTATQELWLKGRVYSTNPALPIVDVSDETRVIGTAREITLHSFLKIFDMHKSESVAILSY